MSIEMPLEDASLTQLQQTPIDNVLKIIDEGLVHLPTYRELYYRWERQQWRAQEIDFSGDRKQWEGMSQDERNMRMYGLSAFFQGEACVTDTLGPYVIAMPDEEKLEDALAVARGYMNEHLKYILIDALSEVAERIQRQPGNLAHLVEGITLYHVIVEGTMALAGQRSILEFYRMNDLFPTFRGG